MLSFILLAVIAGIVVGSVFLIRKMKEEKEPGTTETQEKHTDPEDPTVIFAEVNRGEYPHSGAGSASIGAGDTYSDFVLLMDASSREILAGKQENAKLYPASMTKIMTLIVACEHLTEEDLSRRLELTQEIYDSIHSVGGAYYGNSFYATDDMVGDRFTVKDLLFGVGMRSAADLALMLIPEICGDEEQFVALMNRKASDLGLKGTHFENAVGDESDENYSTAADMAMILSYALKCDLIREILSSEMYQFYAYYTENGVEKSYRNTFYNTLFNDRMEAYKNLKKTDFALPKGVTLGGGKTGYLTEEGSKPANSCLACYLTKGTKTYILILGNAEKTAYTMVDVKTVVETYLK